MSYDTLLLESFRATIAKQEAELAALRADAMRYRWLRGAEDVPRLRRASDLLTGDALDAAIDDAIKEAAHDPQCASRALRVDDPFGHAGRGPRFVECECDCGKDAMQAAP